MRKRRTGTVHVALPAREAIGLFTPEGEREWAPGWDPIYDSDRPGEAPGTTFITTTGGVQTIWIIIDLINNNTTINCTV